MDINRSSGYVTFFGGTNAASDAKLKGEVEDLPTADCLDLLKTVSAKSYVRNDMGADRRCGFIAQEVEAAAAPSLGTNMDQPGRRDHSEHWARQRGVDRDPQDAEL